MRNVVYSDDYGLTVYQTGDNIYLIEGTQSRVELQVEIIDEYRTATTVILCKSRRKNGTFFKSSKEMVNHLEMWALYILESHNIIPSRIVRS